MIAGFVDEEGYLRVASSGGGERRFDSDWNLIIEENEWLIKSGSLEVAAHRREGKVLWDTILEKGFGTLYRTNRRLVFDLKPAYSRAMSDFTPFSIPDTAMRVSEARQLKKLGWKWFLEIDLKEVTSVEVLRWGLRVSLLDNLWPGDQGSVKYQLEVAPREEALALLGSVALND
ncbi:MAG: hypothetical protein V3T94_02770 [Thermoplasmata archaeon]